VSAPLGRAGNGAGAAAREVKWAWGLDRWRWCGGRFLGKERKETSWTMSRGGLRLISLSGQLNGRDRHGHRNKKRDALLGWSLGPGRGIRTNERPTHSITEIIMVFLAARIHNLASARNRKKNRYYIEGKIHTFIKFI
jgi:hypothetical protein